MRFFTHCLIDLHSNGAEVVLSKDAKVFVEFDGTWAHGSWNDSEELYRPILHCSVYGNISRWIPTFTHEYSHFLQWKEKNKYWKAYAEISAVDLSKCLQNRPIRPDVLERCMNVTRDMELDCERRTVALFRAHKLPIDIDGYIRGANVYVHYHNYLKIARTWYADKAPYEIPEILACVPPRFLPQYSTLPPKLLKLFLEYYPPVKHSALIAS